MAKTLHVQIPNREYDIIIERGIFDKAGELIRSVTKAGKAAVVSDSNVAPLYAERFLRSLEGSGFIVKLITVSAGEKSKSLAMTEYLYNEMLDFELTRSDLIVALGGGVVGDLTGFAASTLLRGIPFIQIPTTLLSQVDSSVGGKVAVDLPRGKNLVGTFCQPKRVLIDPDCLQTLPKRFLADGMAEVIKYGAIFDKNLFALLENITDKQNLFAKMEEIIYTCCNWKRQIVEEDEFDTGKRMVLNFGHTFGHAIEKEYHYETYTHGEAVAAGMVMACEFGERNGITKQGCSARMRDILLQFHLPTDAEISHDSLVAAMAVDKKGEGALINLILLSEIGTAVIEKFEKSLL